MEYNNDFRYDLKIGQVKEEELGDIFNSSKIEVKHDLQATKTGNVYVEYYSRGKLSGIATTEADYYCFAIDKTFHLIDVATLKERCLKYRKTNRDREGGDSNTSKGILLPIKELF